MATKTDRIPEKFRKHLLHSIVLDVENGDMTVTLKGVEGCVKIVDGAEADEDIYYYRGFRITRRPEIASGYAGRWDVKVPNGYTDSLRLAKHAVDAYVRRVAEKALPQVA